jgi:acyl carrier protein
MTTQPLDSAVSADTLADDVVGWVREFLEDPSIGPDDNFLDVGGHSLVANRLNVLVKKKYGRKIPLRSLFEESIAAACADAGPA